MTPYWSDETCSLYLGDSRELMPEIGPVDLVVADPPYAETSLAWDRWPDGWLDVAATITSSLWCFGSVRMFLERAPEFAAWKLSQDIVGRDEEGDPITGDVNVVWEKNMGSSRAGDRFRRVHEHVLHWYRGKWGDVHHEVPRITAPPTWSNHPPRPGSSVPNGAYVQHTGTYRPTRWTDDGTRLTPSIISAKNMHRRGIHPTEKPVELLTPLITYACPKDELVLDPFAGSGSTLEAARLSGRRAIGIEAGERYIELAAKRLSQAPLEFA